ncbi:phage tail protein [Pseudoalteromonas sp. Of7M-16]|uniref:phage tail-collar fiber domain-containing protein n=1 Tax=Pseudoalteromonas sp. Of7M-16 TaxID=2917756 RepID=UPI001EF5858F|nr:phage tail protein [Pseudoalteromonas sp. Of7M-16]
MSAQTPTYEIYHFNITAAGESLLLNTQVGGAQVLLTEMAVGTAMYDPAAISDQLALKSEVDRAAILDFERVDKTLQMAAVFDNPAKAYNVGEVGLFTSTGELFAVFSMPNRIVGAKTDAGRFIVKFGLAIDQIPEGAITVDLSNDNVNLIMTRELAQMTLAQVRTSRVQLSMLSREIQQTINGDN